MGIMELFPGLFSPAALAFALGVGLFAGFVKGVVGFAMPMLLISGLSFVLPPDLALAALIPATLATNTWQAFRQGLRAAWATVKRFSVFLIIGFVMLMSSAQLVRVLDMRVLIGLIGAVITVFATLQLLGWRLHVAQRSLRADVMVGSVAGFIGGLSGIWGPPTVAYLTAVNTPKEEHIRAQGVIYGLGAYALALAHFQTGVLRAETLPLGLALVPTSLLGMAIGFRLQDRFSQTTFRRATLMVLALAGVNLLRRAYFS